MIQKYFIFNNLIKAAKHKLVSGALQFTIFIGVVIALLLAALIMLTYSHNFFILQSKSAVENFQLANTGMNYILQNSPITADTLVIQELNDENQSVEIEVSQWGIFEKGIVKTTNRKKIFYKSALIGSQIDTQNRPSVYLQENLKPLVLVGNTTIKGLTFLPEQGVRPGYIGNQGYSRKKLTEGMIRKSNFNLPELKAGYQDHLRNFLDIQNFNEKNYLSERQKNNCTISFLKPTMRWIEEGEIILNNNILTGNIIIKSEKLIRVNKSVILKDVILIAPIIEIEDQVAGSFQAIATKKIWVGKQCRLNYPSALVLFQKDVIMTNTDVNDDQIFIDSNSEIKGSVCSLIKIKENDFESHIILNKNSVIKGEIYCQGNLEFSGKLIGSVFTKQFIVKRMGGIFVNYIYDGQIGSEDLNESFCGILLNNYKSGIVKWMY